MGQHMQFYTRQNYIMWVLTTRSHPSSTSGQKAPPGRPLQWGGSGVPRSTGPSAAPACIYRNPFCLNSGTPWLWARIPYAPPRKGAQRHRAACGQRTGEPPGHPRGPRRQGRLTEGLRLRLGRSRVQRGPGEGLSRGAEGMRVRLARVGVQRGAPPARLCATSPPSLPAAFQASSQKSPLREAAFASALSPVPWATVNVAPVLSWASQRTFFEDIHFATAPSSRESSAQPGRDPFP